MKIGKLPAEVLQTMLSRSAGIDPAVLVGPAYGEDAAAVRFGGRVLVATSDPITFATDRIGYYAVSVSANDIAVMGAEPRFFLATILLPEHSTETQAEEVFDQVLEACSRIGVKLIGGHTEITQAVDRVVICGCMLGDVEERSLVRTSGARVGDALILVGQVALEGTSILARDASDELLAKGVPPDIISRAERLLDAPGICVLDYARTALAAAPVTSMHDPTEGGLVTAIREVASASGCGVRVCGSSIRVLEECSIICNALELDPLGLIASGSLLVAMGAESIDAILLAFEERGVPAGLIGAFTPQDEGIRFDDGTELPIFDRDEIARMTVLSEQDCC